MNQFKKGSKKRYESLSFMYQNDSMPDAEMKQEMQANLLGHVSVPASYDNKFNKSVIESFIERHEAPSENIKQQVSDLEWAIQQSSHLYLIRDLGSNLQFNKVTNNAQDVIERQRMITVLNLDQQQQTRSRLDLKWLSVIEPSSSRLFVWNIMMLILIIVYFYLITLNLYFTKTDDDLAWFWQYWFDGYHQVLHWLFTLILTVDIFIEMHVAYFEKGSYVTDKMAVYRHYLRREFAFDFIPLLMLYSIDMIPYLRGITYLRYAFILKALKIYIYDARFQDRLQLHRKSKAGYLIIKMMVELLMLVQIFAAVFYRVGIVQQQKRLDNPDAFDSWESWLDSGNLFGEIYKKPIIDQYYMSLYWSFGTLTTVSYGDVTPANPPEILVANFAMFGAIFFFAFNVQTIWEVYNEYMETKRKFQKQLIVVNRFMRDKKISVALQDKIRKYLDHMWEKQRARDDQMEKQILDSLAPQLKSELLFESYGRDLLQIPWFQNNFSVEFIKSLSQDLEEVSYTQDEIVFLDGVQNDDEDSLYIIKEGAVELYIDCSKTKLCRLGVDSVFGSYSFLTGDQRGSSAKSLTYSTFYRITRSQFLERLSKFHADYERYCYLRDKVQFTKRLDLINVSCFTCSMTDHTAASCPLTHSINQISEASKIIEQNLISQKRTKYKRRNNKKTKKTTVGVDEYQDGDNPFVNFEQYYQDKQGESYEIDKVHSFTHYHPNSNIDNLQAKQSARRLLNPRYTPPLRHQVEPI